MVESALVPVPAPGFRGLSERVDDTDVNNVYYGYARPDKYSATDEEVWSIAVLKPNGDLIWAEKSSCPDKIWDSRAGYNYT